MKTNSNIQQLVRAALLIALGIILPIALHPFGREVGIIFSPMHIPVLIGGFILSPVYALAVGVLTPFLSHVFTGMPPFPIVYVMVLELAGYGLITSLIYNKLKLGIYPSIIGGMILGRVVNILGNYLILHIIMSNPFSLQAVAISLFVKALPGIIVHLIIVPLAVYALNKSLYSVKDN